MEVELNFTKAVLSCSQTVAQGHEGFLIANDSVSCFQSTGMTVRRAEDYLRCHHALDWLPCALVIHVLRSLECDGYAHDPGRGMPLILPGTRMLYVLVTIIESVSNE